MGYRRIELAQGTLEYTDTGGDGPVVVLLHGALMDDGLWEGVVPALPAGVRAVVPLLPIGAHRVPMPPDADLSPAGLAALVADLLVALDLHDVTVVGNDTGGAVAQVLVTTRPERVGGMVLVSCDAFDNFPPGLPGATMALACRVPGMLYGAMLSLRLPAMRRLPMTFGWMTRRPIRRGLFDRWLASFLASKDVRRDVRRMMSRVDRRDLLAAAERLPAFDRPALIVWAAQDRVMPPEHAERLAALLPRGEHVLVEDSYTLVPLDQPGRLAELIGRFVTGAPDQPGWAARRAPGETR